MQIYCDICEKIINFDYSENNHDVVYLDSSLVAAVRNGKLHCYECWNKADQDIRQLDNIFGE